MDINERLKELRKTFGISQEELGNKIGLSKSGISNIESGTRKVTDKHIKLLCSEFPINEYWLRTGTGEMRKKTPSDTMEQIKKEFNLDEFSYNLVHEYLKLESAQREKVRDFFYRVIESESDEQEKLSVQQEADKFGALAREQFIAEKRQESQTLFAKKSGAS